MAEICVFCKEQIESPYPPRLEENKMFMFEILMEQTSFDKGLLIDSPICDDCDKTITNFFNFKSNFMETEDEFINYMDSNKKVDLYDVLVKTFKLKKFENENVPIRVCRICFKATQVEGYKEIKSLESKLAIMVTMCLPEFNIKLTNHTYLCPECYTVILQYYHFLLLCSEATKSKKQMSADISEPLSKKRSISEIIEDTLSKLEKERINLKVPDALSKEKTILKTDSLSSKKVGSQNSVPRKRRSSSEASMSDPLAISSGEPKDKKKKVEKNVSDPNEASDSSSLLSSILTKPFQPARRPRGRPRTKGLSPKPTTKPERFQQVTKATSVPTNVRYECQVCPEILHTYENLKQHITAHQSEKDFFCWQCGFKCYNFGAMYTHFGGHGMHLFKMVDDENNEDNTATESSKITTKNGKEDTPSTIDSADIDRNLLSVQRTDIYTPPDVKKARKKRGTNRMSSGRDKSQHTYAIDKKDTGNKYFQCQICLKVFDSVVGWTDHIKFHRNQGSILCWRCKTWFKSLDSLRDHIVGAHFVTNFYKLVPAEAVQFSKREKEIHHSVINEDKTTNKSPPSYSSSSTIPCIQCKQIFDHIDLYMDHVCKFRPNEEPLPKKNVEDQAFNCGHCNTIFYSLDDLDDHNCMPMKSVRGTGEKSGIDSMGLNRKSGISQISIINSQLLTGSTVKNSEADYECSYCLLTFHTITGLDNHTCKGDSESTIPENIAVLNTAPVTACGAVAVKTETLFECSYCMILFESGMELNQHKCSNAPANAEVTFTGTEAVSINSEAILDNTACDGMSRLLKVDPEYDRFLPLDSGVELEKENCDDVQCDTKVSDGERASKNTDDVLKSTNVQNQDKLHDTPESARVKKKNAINKIANMFGVNIVEGKDREKDENSNKNHSCIGCGFTSTNHKDLMFHFGFCDKIFRCSYCSYGTNISQKLEIHSWAVHNILIFVCPWCTFVTSMEENYDAHILTHKENCQNDDVQYISDDGEEQPKSPKSMLEQLFNYAKIKDGIVSVSENGLQSVNQKARGVGQRAVGNGNRIDLDEDTINRPQATVTSSPQNETAFTNLSDEDTLSVENIWPDSDDDLDDSEAFRIPRDTIDNRQGDGANENDPLATEPVWLVSSSAVNENAVNRQTEVDVETPEERSYRYNQSELIIPDRIIPEPTGFKLEPLEDPLAANDTEPQHSERSPDASITESDTSKPSNNGNAETVKTEPLREASKLSLNNTESIVINCDSDNEFVESSDSRISSVAANAGEVVPISASEASKLISEGIPVISEASLIAMQNEAAPKVTGVVAMEVEMLPKSSDTPEAVGIIEDPSLPCQKLNSVLSKQNRENDEINSPSTVLTDKELKPAGNSKEKDVEPNSANVDRPQLEPTKELSDRNALVGKEKDPGMEATRNDSNEEADISNRDDNIDSTKRKIKVTIERQLEDDGANSDASSFFVTDNEDSDKEDLEESRKKSATKLNKGSAKALDGMKQKELGSNKIVKNPFLPIVICKSLTKEKSLKTSEAVGDSLGNSGKISTVNTEESFVISDDDDNDVHAKEKNVPVKEKQTTKIQILYEAIKPSTGKKVIIKRAQVVPSKNKSGDTKKIGDRPSPEVKKSILIPRFTNVPGLTPVTKIPASLRTYSKARSNSGVQITTVQNNAPTGKDPVKVVTSATYPRTFSNMSNQNKTTEKNVGVSTGAAKDTNSKTASNLANQSIRVKKSTPVQKKVVKKPAVVTQDPWVIIDDDGEDILADKPDKDKTPASRSRNDSSSSSIILDRDFSKEAEEEVVNDSGDDCVFVSEDSSIKQSKNLGPAKTAAKEDTSLTEKGLSLPPNALNLFIAKVKSEIQKKYPDLPWGAQKSIILDAWRNMSNEDKWPFKEEARLHRILFKREHPDQPIRKKKATVQTTPKAKIDEKTFRRAVMTYFKVNSISISDTARRHGLNTKTFQRRLQKLREKKTKEEIMKEMADVSDTDSSDDSLAVIEPLPPQPDQQPLPLEDTGAIVLD